MKSDAPLPEQDLLAIVEYLDGQLDELQRMRLEVRLSEEPALAAEFESLARLDELERAARARTATPPTRVRDAPRPALHPLRWAPLAAAAAVLAIALWRPWADADLGLEVGVIASATTLSSLHEQLELEIALPEGVDRVRGGEPERDASSWEEYEAHVIPRLDAVAQRALEAGGERARASRFAVTVRLARDASVLIVHQHQGRAPECVFPSEPWSAASGRVTRGRVHVLPQDLIAAGRGSFEPGILLPGSSAWTTVLVGVREHPLDAALGTRWREFLAGLDASTPPREVRDWLESAGFVVRELRVDEP